MVELTFGDSSQNIAARILLESAQELLGAEALRKISSGRIPDRPEKPTLAETSAVLQALEEHYGANGGQGLSVRIGQAAFRYGLQQLGGLVGFRTVEFRLLPAPRRLESGLRTLARVIAKACDCDVIVSDEDLHWSWKMQRPSGEAGLSCFLIIGLLQEFASWAGNGRFYRVSQVACQSKGEPACIFQIEKKPLD